MSRTIFITILQFILISLAQILLLNNVQLFGYVQPILYIWFLILLPNNTPKWLLMILGFTLGLTMDLFSTQLGFHTATATLTATLKPLVLSWFTNHFDNNTFRPSVAEMGLASFLGFTSVITLLHTTIYICIETFTFSELGLLLIEILLSTIVSIILILICDTIFIRTKRD